MRHSVLTLTGALVCAAALAAQQPQPQPPQKPAQQPAANALDQVLASWERAMTGLNSFSVQCTLTTLDKTFQTNDVFEGKALYLKPNRASLELTHKTKPDRWKRMIISGSDFYEFVPGDKVVRQHKLQARGGGIDDNFMSFILGMKADDAKKKYQLTLTFPNGNDPHYHYVEVVPRNAQDKADFAKLRLVLVKATHLPRQLWFEQPNGNEETWDFPQVVPNAPLRPEQFAVPRLPADWRIVPIAAEAAPPRVIRQQQ